MLFATEEVSVKLDKSCTNKIRVSNSIIGLIKNIMNMIVSTISNSRYVEEMSISVTFLEPLNFSFHTPVNFFPYLDFLKFFTSQLLLFQSSVGLWKELKISNVLFKGRDSSPDIGKVCPIPKLKDNLSVLDM